MTINFYNLFVGNWFSTKGRANRTEYVCRFLMMPVFGMLSRYCFNFFYIDEDSLLGLFSGFIAACILTPLFLTSIIQIFFVTHRRLHDLNASGWWQLITFIPLGQILMIGFIFFKGTERTNRYGEPPKN